MFSTEVMTTKTPIPIYPHIGKLRTKTKVLEMCMWAGFNYDDLNKKWHIRTATTSPVTVAKYSYVNPILSVSVWYLYNRPTVDASSTNLLMIAHSKTNDLMKLIKESEQITYAMADTTTSPEITVVNTQGIVRNSIMVEGKPHEFIISRSEPELLESHSIYVKKYDVTYYLSYEPTDISDVLHTIIDRVFKLKMGI